MLKDDVREFWEKASCGEELYLTEISEDGYVEQMEHRYELEPYIPEFAEFGSANGKKVLEIGVGLGADHQKYAENGADLHGIDLTDRAIGFSQSTCFRQLRRRSRSEHGGGWAAGCR